MNLKDLTEEEFAMFVITEAKKILTEEEQKKIDKKKLNILCCLVAKEVGYPLTMGWFK